MSLALPCVLQLLFVPNVCGRVAGVVDVVDAANAVDGVVVVAVVGWWLLKLFVVCGSVAGSVVVVRRCCCLCCYSCMNVGVAVVVVVGVVVVVVLVVVVCVYVFVLVAVVLVWAMPLLLPLWLCVGFFSLLLWSLHSLAYLLLLWWSVRPSWSL